MILCQSENISKQDLGSNRSLFPDNYELVFQKPVYDIAFVSNHTQLSSKVNSLQNYFQSKHKFTTHHLFLDGIEETNAYLGELKKHGILYAIVLNENSEITNLYDLYVLHRDEVLTTVTIEKVEELIEKDFSNLMNKVKILKTIPSKSPHQEDFVRISEQLRHYLCLLFDYRTLTMKELKYVKDYLINRKDQLEKEERDKSLKSQNNELQSYSVYEPSQLKDHRNSYEFTSEEKSNCIQPSRFVFKGNNRNSSSTVIQLPHSEFKPKPSTNYTIFDAASDSILPKSVSQYRISNSHLDLGNSFMNSTDTFFNSNESFSSDPKHMSNNSDSGLDRSNKYLFKRTSDSTNTLLKKMPLCKAEIMSKKLASTSGIFGKVIMKMGRVSKLQTEYQKAKLSNSYSKKKDNSVKVKYSNSTYFRNKIKESPSKSYNHKSSSVSNRSKEVIGNVNDSKENRLDFDKHASKRKLEITNFTPIKLNKLDIVSSNAKLQVVNNPLFIPPKSSPDSLINLFVMVLNLIPIELPNNNAIYNIMSNSCVEIQEGIMEPALKNVKINYDNCKANGVNEIIANIYSIYNESEKEVKNASFMIFIWNKYFPSQLSNFNLMILFYKFVKLLMLYTMFNKSLVTKKLVLDVIDKIDVIVNFDFKSSVSTFKRKQLSCFSNKFEKYFKEHDQLHVLYAKLTNSKSIIVDKKKLDATIKKKKIIFTVGPLLEYFITSINSIHNQMEPIQIEMIYGAIRTLRFCLRKINLKLLQTSFTKPHLFNFRVKKMDSHLAEILKEIKLLCKELKYYQCVLFTEKHYDFINCLLDFSWMLEGIIDCNSEAYKSKPLIEPLMVFNSKDFIHDFASFESPIFLQYHPESELEYLKGYLKERWTAILNEAFIGSIPEPCGSRIINEINVLLPPSWGLLTFDEAITEASKLYYEGFHKLVETDPNGWYAKFTKSKSCAKDWLTKYHLPITSLEVLNDYQYMLESKYKYAT